MDQPGQQPGQPGYNNQQMLAVGNNIVKNIANVFTALQNAFPAQANGSFTLTTLSATTVSNANVKASSIVLLMPTNAAAGTLQGATTSLFVSSLNAGASFTVKTAAGVPQGTETFSYLIVNLT